MRNKILAIFLILIICVSMIPINVYAASTQELALTKHEIKTDGYTIHYFAPEGYSDVFILKDSDTKFHLYYLESGGKYLCNSDGYGKVNAPFARIKNITSIEEIYKILFLGEYTTKSFQTYVANESYYTGDYTIHGTLNRMYVSPSLDSLGSVNVQDHIDEAQRTDYMTFAEFYSEWYFSVNGIPPQPDLEDSEYMQGQYYIITKQDIESKGGQGTHIDKGKAGYVETCEDATVYAKDTVFTYVVMSFERATADILSTSFTSDVFGDLLDWWTGNADVAKMYEIINADGELGEERNGYIYEYHPYNMVYSEDEYLNRYYFSSLEDASKFVLYGTAGAMYDYKETGKTHYGYGYQDIIYNNFDIGGFPATEIPVDQYPLQKGQVLLQWHDENVAEREYLIINFDYFPFASVYTTEKKITISSRLNPEYYVAYKTEENENTFKIKDFSNYEKTEKYNYPKLQKFQIYHKDLEEMYISNSWDIVWTSHSIYGFKATVDENGNLIISSGSIYEDEAIIQTKTDEDGNKIIYDSLNDVYRKEGEEDDPYINTGKDENGDGINEYENSKGDILDPSTLTDSMKDWRESLQHYQSTLKDAAELINDFTDIINNFKDEMAQLTKLINKFFSSIPTFFRTLITFLILAIVLMRILRRK